MSESYEPTSGRSGARKTLRHELIKLGLDPTTEDIAAAIEAAVTENFYFRADGRYKVTAPNGDQIHGQDPVRKLANVLAVHLRDGKMMPARTPKQIQEAQRRAIGYAAP